LTSALYRFFKDS